MKCYIYCKIYTYISSSVSVGLILSTMPNLSTLMCDISKPQTSPQLRRTLRQLTTPENLHDIRTSPDSTEEGKNLALMLLMRVALSTRDEDLLKEASQYLNLLGHESWNHDLHQALMDKTMCDRSFYNVVTGLLHLVDCHVRGEMTDGPYIGTAVDNYRHSYVVWKFPRFFTKQMPLADLCQVHTVVMALYKQGKPCVRDVSLFQHMRNVLTARLNACGDEKEKKSIQDMLNICNCYFAEHVLQFFTEQTHPLELYRLLKMVMALREEDEGLRLKIEPHVAEMCDILTEVLNLFGNDAAESTSIRAMLKTVNALQPEQ